MLLMFENLIFKFFLGYRKTLKSATKIVNFMISRVGVLTAGFGQNGQKVLMYIIFKNSFFLLSLTINRN